ncbi:MAG: DUF1573 domain-containing protein, partial [Flavobacteriales bacterium]|nr:DUF1573 domain-containing protein [Flavobacteriales bacterium]
FDKKVLKLDPIQEDSVLNLTFPFENKGDVPLIISNYKVECSCTVVEYPQTPILPGETGTINVTFNSSGKVGWQYRKILLFANVKKGQSEIEFRVKVVN